LSSGGRGGERKKVPPKKGLGGIEREKEKRRDEEKESLLARIGWFSLPIVRFQLKLAAELEARLSGLTPSDSRSSGSEPKDFILKDPSAQSWLPDNSTLNTQTMPGLSMSGGGSGPILDEIGSVPAVNPDGTEWDFGDLFVVPAHWPKNLPSPCESTQVYQHSC